MACSKDLCWGQTICIVQVPACGDIVKCHGLSCHFYADDTQLYCSFKLHDQVVSVQVIESCLNDIDAWMLAEHVKAEQG